MVYGSRTEISKFIAFLVSGEWAFHYSGEYLYFSNDPTELINELISGSKRYGKLAIENSEKWVSAGYAGANTNPDKLYCYCGEGNGYQGAEVTPASGIAVIYDTQEAAEATKGYTTWNGYGEKIVLEPMEAYKFFNILQADVYKAALLTIRLINLPK